MHRNGTSKYEESYILKNDNQAKILIFTGKGGVGKTTCAASTALHLSEQGVSTLIISTDPAHSLGDCLQQKLNPSPIQIVPNLWAMELDSLREMHRRIDSIREVLVNQMQKRGLSEIVSEEMVAFPGAEELFSLLKIIELKKTGRYDVIILDTAPTGNTMRFLNFPEFLSPLRRALKVDRYYSRAIRPFATLLKQPIPKDEFYSSIFSLFEEIEKARSYVMHEKTYFRFVLNPEKLAVLETQRAVSFLNISGYTVDGIIVNKILPKTVTDSFFDSWKQIQKTYIKETKESFYPLKILEAPLYEKEIIGNEMLSMFSKQLYNGQNPLSRLTKTNMFVIERKGSSVLLTIRVPYKERDDFKLYKQGQELIVDVPPYEQKIQLPVYMSSLEVKKAQYVKNSLIISFS